MPTPKRPFDESGSSVRGGIPDPLAPEIDIPVVPLLTYPPLPENYLEEIHTELDATGEICIAAEMAVMKDAMSLLAKTDEIDRQIHIAILGDIGTKLDKMERVT